MIKKINQILHKTVFIIGSEKNAGKTTYLNYILRQVRQHVSPAFLTIGIDGEPEDLIFGTPKPQVYAEPGDVFITSEIMLERSSGLFSLLHIFPEKTALGRLVLAQTLRGGYVELVGPENNIQLKNMFSVITNETGNDTILIDGAANRVTQVATDVHASFIYVLKVSPENIHRSLEKLKILEQAEGFPCADKCIDTTACHCIAGALTTTKLKQIPDDCTHIIVNDFTKFFISAAQLRTLAGKFKIMFRECYELLHVVINLKDMDKSTFEKKIEHYSLGSKVLFNPYQYDEMRGSR